MRIVIVTFVLSVLSACGTSGPSCDDVSNKLISVLSEQGDDAFLKASDAPMVSKACVDNGWLEKHKEAADCLMATKDLAGLESCKTLDAMLKSM